MNSQQILQCCLIALLSEDQITGYQIEEISDEEAALILKLISEGNYHLDYRQIKSGINYGKLYPFPAAHCNYVDNDSETYKELSRIWAITK